MRVSDLEARLKSLSERSHRTDDASLQQDLERVAQMALEEGIINQDHYKVLKHRVPFGSADFMTYSELGANMGVSRNRVQQYLRMASHILLKHLPRYSGQTDLMDLPITCLPFRYGSGERIVMTRLARATEGGRVRDAVAFLKDYAAGYRHSNNNLGFGRFSYRVAQEALGKIGIKIPHLT